MADPRVYTDDYRKVLGQLDDIRRRVRNLEVPTDTQFSQTVRRILQLFDQLDEQVASAITATSYTRQQIDSRDTSTLDAARAYAEPRIGVLGASKGGTNTANGYNNLFSVGPYRAAWLLSDGTLGTSQSSRTVKTDFHEPDITLEQLRSVDWIGYRYIRDVNENGDSALPRVGMIAEDLDDAGLGIFVVYDDDTLEPAGIDYATLSVAAMHMAKLAHDRIDRIETRLSALEPKEQS